MKNKLGIVFVLGMASGFDIISAMEKRGPNKGFDPFEIEKQKVDIRYSSANFQEPENADSFSKLLDELGAPRPKARLIDLQIENSENGFFAQDVFSNPQRPNQKDSSTLINLHSDTANPHFSPILQLENFQNSMSVQISNSQSSENTSTDSLSSVSGGQNSADLSTSNMSKNRFKITYEPAGYPSSNSSPVSVSLGNPAAFNDESKNKSASFGSSDLRRKSRFEISIKPANYPDLHGLPKQAPLASRFKITRSQASNPGKEPNF